MTNSKELFRELLNKITLRAKEEAAAIVYYLLEEKIGLSRNDILLGKSTSSSLPDFESEIVRINNHEPIQYITGTAWFRNRKFKVNSSVLIPRPETELLVQEVINEKKAQLTILDIGTGSGCIAISLALEIPHSEVYSIDISADAIATAKENAKLFGATVEFIQSDFLTDNFELNNLDIVVSNPPYVMEKEKREMEENVLSYEPHLALFVPNDDSLIFYRALAAKGKKILKEGGKVIAEINSQLGKETSELFYQQDYQNIKLIQDLEGKDRIVVATR